MDKNPKRTYRKRKKVDLLMALSFLIIGATFIVTLMTFIFPAPEGNIFMVLVCTWQALALTMANHWFQRKKDEKEEVGGG